MCGIAGVFGSISDERLTKLDNLVNHYITKRGPDHTGLMRFDNCGNVAVSGNNVITEALWHKRLSIIDISPEGNQPMVSTNGTILVFNGEIYNYIELRTELKGLGKRFTTNSDTEVVLQAYETWHLEAFNKFIGMFAITLIDAQRDEIVFIRDSIGIKPFYYSESKGLCFSSRADLTSKMAEQHELNFSTIFNFAEYGITDNDDATMFNNVYSLLPGEIRIYSRKNLSLKKTSMVQYSYSAIDQSDTNTPKHIQLRQLLLKTVNLHCRTDVGFCTTLSGGLDSTAIISLLKNNGLSDIKAYSYIPADHKISEEKWVDIVGDHYGVKVKKIGFLDDHFWDDFDDFIFACDMPVNSSSMYSQYKIYQAVATDGNKVVLDGQGGDEMFGGYVQYLYYKGYEELMSLKIGRFIKLISGAKQTINTSFLLKNITRLMLYNSSSKLYRAFRQYGNDAILDSSFFESRSAIKPLNFSYETNTLKKKLSNDLKYQDLPRLLRYADRSSMHWSLESRVPFASQPIARFMAEVTPNDIVDETGLTKSLFRKAVGDLLPQKIRHRRDKMGFNTNFKELLFSENMKDRITSTSFETLLPFINRQHLIKSLDKDLTYDPAKLWRITFLINWAGKL